MLIPRTLDDLKRIVAERIEESTCLEFKRQLPESGKNEDMSRLLEALANSDGGVIVYGIEEDGSGRAKALNPIDTSGAEERVRLIANSLDEPLPAVNVEIIQAEGEEDKGFLVVEVPRSERAPHLFRGLALGRSGKVNAPLTRRQVGEAFARSPGFAEEFGIRQGRRGEVRLRLVREPYQEGGTLFGEPELVTLYRYELVLENPGDEDVFDVDWEWRNDDAVDIPDHYANPFPVGVLYAGTRVSVRIESPLRSLNDPDRALEVKTVWKDRSGQEFTRLWPITF